MEGGGGSLRDTSSRGNIDSGFLSEAPDELGLLRGASVESLGSATSEERGGVASPPLLTPDEEKAEVVEPEIWDEARVSGGCGLKEVRGLRQSVASIGVESRN